MVNKQLTKKFMPKKVKHEVAPIGRMGDEPLILPNYSGVKNHVQTVSGFDDRYLKLDGSNANTTVDIGLEDFKCGSLTTTNTIFNTALTTQAILGRWTLKGIAANTNDLIFDMGSTSATIELLSSTATKIGLTGFDLGIRTTNPGAPLDVVGKIRISGAFPHRWESDFNGIFQATTGLIEFNVDSGFSKIAMSNADVGIRTITPDATIQVVGDCKFGDDNTNYVEIGTTGDVVFVGGAGLAFGDLYGQNTSSTLTITTSGKANKVQVTAFDTNGHSNNTSPDHTNDHITITKAGMYLINISMTLDSLAGSAAEFGFSLFKNNGATEFGNVHVIRDLPGGGGGNHGSVSMNGIVDLAVNDTLELWGWNNANTQNVMIDSVTMSIMQIGGT